ncbi:MAG: AAA family ATPase [Gammaproteobacteria bacterium]|nr:AAA family ATPase [Gammaproteobacteria bacterium]
MHDEPYYECVANEVEIFDAAYRNQLPVLLKGPAGCGKTRFVEHMVWRFKRLLITVSCHDDLTASDLVGRFFDYRRRNHLGGRSAGARGAIFYLDEIIEARKGTTVAIHLLADDRQVLPIDKLGEFRRVDQVAKLPQKLSDI